MTNKIKDSKQKVTSAPKEELPLTSDNQVFQLPTKPESQPKETAPVVDIVQKMEARKEQSLAKQKSDKLKSTVGKIFDILLIPVLIFVVLFAGSLLFTKKFYGIPMFFGYTMVTVVSPSMVDAGFNVGSRAFIKRCQIDDYEIGDIIAFFDYVDPDVFAPNEVSDSISPQGNGRGSRIVFHRILDILVDSNGNKWFITKGDNNALRDSNPIYENYVIGKNVPVSNTTKNFINFIISIKGAVLVVVIPCAFVLFKDCLILTDIYFEFKDEKEARKKFEEENPLEAEKERKEKESMKKRKKRKKGVLPPPLDNEQKENDEADTTSST